MEFKQPIIERHKINDTSKEILATDFNNISEEKYFSLVMNKMYVQQPVMYEEELSKLFEHFATQPSNEEEMLMKNEINFALLNYVSNDREIDKKTKKTTLDRAYIEFYRIAEKYPEEMSKITTGTNPLEEYVSPDVFFDQYLKIKDSEILNKYFGGKQFSLLEYNMTYQGTEKYLESLLNKINFKNSNSCLSSSRLMNLSASLADYANNGSYSGSYNIGDKITSSLKSRSDDPESIYLLGSKANYIVDRLKKGWPPFVHKNKIFEIAPNMLGINSENNFFILSTKDNYVLEQYEVYKSLCIELDNPPQYLIDLAIKNGQDFVSWEPDKGLTFERDMIEEDLKSEMIPFKDFYLKKDSVSESQMNEFFNLIRTDYRIFLEEEFNFKLSDLSIEEQFYFLEYIQTQTNESIKSVKDLTKNFGKNSLRTFLSIEHGGKEMGDKIIALGEKLPEDSAEVLFKTYGDMIDASEEVGQLLQENLGDNATPEIIEQTKNSLLIGGKDLLDRYAKKSSMCEGLDCETLGEELKEKLSLAKKSVFAFSYACKTLVERGEFSFEEFEKVKLVYAQSPVSEEIGEKMTAMHNENTKQYPEKLKEKWRGTFKSGLENPNPNQLIVYVSFEEEVVSSMRVIKREDGSWYGASFNVNPTVQGSKVGSELLKKVLYDLAKDKPFVADCYSKNPMLDTYLNKFGFKITKEIENYEDTGELVYEITLYPEN